MCLIREESNSKVSAPIKAASNHQVLAYKYQSDPRSTGVHIYVYDPTYGRDDRVVVAFERTSRDGFLHGLHMLDGNKTAPRMRGFFLVPYDRKT